jgi:TPR repeat protein
MEISNPRQNPSSHEAKSSEFLQCHRRYRLVLDNAFSLSVSAGNETLHRKTGRSINKFHQFTVVRCGQDFVAIVKQMRDWSSDSTISSGFGIREGRQIELDSIDSAKYFKLVADQNSAAAQNNYGLCLAEGRGVKVDLIGAAKYLKLSADQNLAGAQFN